MSTTTSLLLLAILGLMYIYLRIKIKRQQRFNRENQEKHRIEQEDRLREKMKQHTNS